MSELDEQLRDLIQRVHQAETKLQRRLALNALLRKLQNLPGLLQSSHQDYAIALNQTWDWVCHHLDRFNAEEEDVAKNLKNWVNAYLKWRMHDLLKPDHYFSLDDPVSEDATRADLIVEPDARKGEHFFLDLLDREIEADQIEKRQNLAQKIAQYVMDDPDRRLRDCHARGKPACNAQFLALRLCLKQPPDKLPAIADELQMSYQTVHSHWKRRCKPLLVKLTEEFSPEL